MELPARGGRPAIALVPGQAVIAAAGRATGEIGRVSGFRGNNGSSVGGNRVRHRALFATMPGESRTQFRGGTKRHGQGRAGRATSWLSRAGHAVSRLIVSLLSRAGRTRGRP